MSGSRTTLAGRLARLGFADAARAERLLLTDLGIDPDEEASEPGADPLLTALAAAADPDLALTGLARCSAPRTTGPPCARRCATNRSSATG